MELARRDGVLELGEAAVELALSLTGSSQAVLAMGKREFGGPRFFSREADRSRRLTDVEAADLLVGSGAGGSGTPSLHFNGKARIAAELQVAGDVLGALVVARAFDYTDADRQAFAIFASQAAHALEVAI